MSISLEQKQSFQSNKIVNQNSRNNTIAVTPPKYSVFDKSFQQGTTFNAGTLIPVLLQEVYPGDIYEIKTDILIRLSAPSSTPFMNINFDLNFFYVPYTQIDPEFKEFMGEVTSKNADLNLNVDYNRLMKTPSLEFGYGSSGYSTNEFKYSENDLANYFNIPINFNFNNNQLANSHRKFNLNILPFLAYGKIWNDWYRNQNYVTEADISSVFAASKNRTLKWAAENTIQFGAINTGNNNISMGVTYNSDNAVSTIITGKGLLPTYNFKDYFQSILPSRQKIVNWKPNINASFNNIPVYVETNFDKYGSLVQAQKLGLYGSSSYAELTSNDKNKVLSTGNASSGSPSLLTRSENQQNAPYYDLYVGLPNMAGNYFTGSDNSSEVGSTVSFDLSSFRDNLVLQHLFETLEITGSRYVEQLASIWGIKIDPKQINRSEFVGGENFSLIFNNTQQTSANTNVNNNASLLGNTISSSLYNNVSASAVKFSGEQHGLLLGLVTARTSINYGSQGLPKIFTYDTFLDFYNPKFNGISDQPVSKIELSLTPTTYQDFISAVQSDTFTGDLGVSLLGYQEPFLNLKNNINNANGFLSIKSTTSLFSMFLFGTSYVTDNDSRNLNMESIVKYDPNIIDNSLFKVTPNTNQFYHQFIALFSFNIKYTSKQPLYTHPGVNYV